MRVADEGPGVPPEDRNRIFEPFVRLDSDEISGTGIGLFSSRRVVEAQGGSIWFEDRPKGERGSVFAFSVPLAQERRAMTSVLIVDDDRAMVGMVASLLGSEGYDLLTAYDGETAVRRHAEELPDLVILDRRLPKMSGERGLQADPRERPDADPHAHRREGRGRAREAPRPRRRRLPREAVRPQGAPRARARAPSPRAARRRAGYRDRHRRPRDRHAGPQRADGSGRSCRSRRRSSGCSRRSPRAPASSSIARRCSAPAGPTSAIPIRSG